MTLMRKKLLKNPPLKMMIHQGKQIMFITLLVLFCLILHSLQVIVVGLFQFQLHFVRFSCWSKYIWTSSCDRLSSATSCLKYQTFWKYQSYVCTTTLNAGYNDFLIIAFFSVYLWILNLFQWPGWGRLLWLFTHLYQRTNSQLCSRKNNEDPR